MPRIAALLLSVATLAACGGTGAPDASHATAATPAPATTNVLAGTPMAAYGHALNKAKNVQNVIDAQAKKQAGQIDAATGSSSD